MQVFSPNDDFEVFKAHLFSFFEAERRIYEDDDELKVDLLLDKLSSVPKTLVQKERLKAMVTGKTLSIEKALKLKLIEENNGCVLSKTKVLDKLKTLKQLEHEGFFAFVRRVDQEGKTVLLRTP